MKRETVSEVILRELLGNLVVMGDGLHRLERGITLLLRLADDLSVETARRIAPSCGVSAVRMDELVRIARCNSMDWCEWLTDSHSVNSFIRLLDARK